MNKMNRIKVEKGLDFFIKLGKAAYYLYWFAKIAFEFKDWLF